MVENTISMYYPNFRLGRKEAIFGDIYTEGDSLINTMLLLGKQFIWRQKFGSKTLDEISFILYMKYELNFLDFKGEKDKFCKEWENILSHFEVGN